MSREEYEHRTNASTVAPAVSIAALAAMSVQAWTIAGVGYLFWLGAGWLDFFCHRRTDLPRTSGVVESALHLSQLGIIGTALLLGMALSLSLALFALLTGLVVVHAGVGYVDTLWSWQRRSIGPLEQHVHSVLDAAPIIALVSVIALGWEQAWTQGWSLALRDPPLPAWLWAAVLVPAIVICGVPAVCEFTAAWKLSRHAHVLR